jgi:predicted nucleic acid-binding protein
MTAGGERTFVDSNVWVYVFDHRDSKKQARARTIIDGLADDVVVSTQVVQETYWNLVRKLKAPASDAAALAAEMLELPTIQVSPDLILAAIGRSRKDPATSFWDALIVEAALAGGCTRLVSEDLQHGRVFDRKLRVENPFGGT